MKGLFKGSIAIPLLSEKERFTFTIPLTVNGFATGYLDQSLDGLAFVFNPDGGEQKIDLTINRAVFANKQRLDMNIDLKWPFLDIDLKSLEGFKVWGNGNIGFLTPNGSASLTNQVQTKIKGFEANIDYIGCGRQGNLYAFGTSAKVVMAEDVAGPDGAPIANIYSITKNILLDGGTSFSNMPDAFQNIIAESARNTTAEDNTVGLSQGGATQNDSLKVVFGEEVNLEVASMLNDLNAGEKTDIDSTLYAITQTTTSEENTSPAFEGEVTIEQIINLIDVVSPFLNDEQRQRAEDFKNRINEFNNNELVILYKELKDLDQFIKKTAKDILRNLVDRIKQPIIEQSNTIKEKVVGFIDNKRDNLLSAIDSKINKLIDELAKKATNAFSPSDLEGKESIIAEIISSTAEATKVGLTTEINRSVSASIKENLTDKVIGIIDTAIVYNITSFIDSTLLRTGNAIIEKGVNADLRLNQIGQDAKSLLPTIGKDLSNRILAINFENTITATITDAYTGIRWDSIGNYIAEQVLTELIANKLMDVVTTTVVNTVTNLLGEDGGAVAGALMNNVNFDFSNLGDKLKNGEFDKIIKFDPSYIKVKTSVAEFEGWTKFTDKDPLWGDSWQATLSAKITTGFCFKASSKYINGSTTATSSNFKYWFLELGVDDLGIQLGAVPLTLNGAKGRVFHHMKRVSNEVYQPADSVKFGAGVQLFFYDTPTSAAILAFDVSTDITVLDGGFIFEMSGNAYIANLTVTVKGRKIISRYLAVATGYICYNSVENHLVGLFEAHTNTSPLLCIGGELSVDIGKGHWSVAVGTREKPLFVNIFCLNKPVFQGWFAINNNGLDLGLMTYIHVKASSPWIGFTGFKVKPWAEFKFDFGATAIILWKPSFEIPEAHVWIELYAGIGVKYKFLFSSGNLTIASVNVGGEVMFSTTPDAYIEGKIKGKVTVFNVGVGFKLDLKYNFS